MPADPNDLTTIDNALAWLGLQQDDPFGSIQRLITAVSTRIQNHIGRTIALTTYNITLDGRGRRRYAPPNYPIVSVSSVQIVYGSFANVVIPARTAGQPGYTFSNPGPNLPGFIYVDPPYIFEKGLQNIAISYQAGFTTVPLDLEQACLTWIKATLDSANYSANLAKAIAGQTTLDFSATMSRFNSGVVPIPPGVLQDLQPYRRVISSW